ncbi:hypothetical protein BSAF29S_04407 [Bacillus safensis subsp. safensis]
MILKDFERYGFNKPNAKNFLTHKQRLYNALERGEIEWMVVWVQSL